MKIITLTLNTSFDMHCYVERFRPFHENIADIASFEAGGKGVNISRALTYNGVENLAVIVVGDENSAEFVKMLDKDNIQPLIVKTTGRIRENVTLHSGDGADETRISFHGFTCEKSVLKDIEEKVGEVNADTIITFIVAPSNSVCSQSFLFAAFDDDIQANNFKSYLLTKFFRTLVSAIKISQSAPNRVYKFVPLQDFTNNSDIDWSKSINEIDKQLYNKYGLTQDEIEFIENKIKPME